MDNENIQKTLQACMWEGAQLYAALDTDKPVIEYYGAWDGLKIPPSTRVKVLVVLEHLPDPETMPIFKAQELIGV